jgi:predicted site-specific integrase-resolvase
MMIKGNKWKGDTMKTIKEFAEIMNVSEVTARRWITDRKVNVLQQYKKGAIRISEEEIERLKKGE